MGWHGRHRPLFGHAEIFGMRAVDVRRKAEDAIARLELRTLAAAGEATEVKDRSPGRGPPYWKSRVLRRQVLGEEDEGGGRGSGADEVA
jgi:hypothetical protein